MLIVCFAKKFNYIFLNKFSTPDFIQISEGKFWRMLNDSSHNYRVLVYWINYF